jgi:hypothetical protein
MEAGKRGEFPFKYNVIYCNTATGAEQLEIISKYIDAFKLKVHVDKVYPLEQARQGFLSLLKLL